MDIGPSHDSVEPARQRRLYVLILVLVCFVDLLNRLGFDSGTDRKWAGVPHFPDRRCAKTRALYNRSHFKWPRL